MSNKPTEVFVPFNTPSSKNGRQWTGKHLIASKATQKWRKLSKPYWKSEKPKFLQMIQGLPKPLNLEFTFIRDSRRKFDYVNPLQTILDEMVAYGWIEDDDCLNVKPFFGTYSVNKLKAGVIIKVKDDIHNI